MAQKASHKPLLDIDDLTSGERFVVLEVAKQLDQAPESFAKSCLLSQVKGILDNPEFLGHDLSRRLKEKLRS